MSEAKDCSAANRRSERGEAGDETAGVAMAQEKTAAVLCEAVRKKIGWSGLRASDLPRVSLGFEQSTLRCVGKVILP